MTVDKDEARFRQQRERHEQLRDRLHHWSQLLIGALTGTVPSSSATRFLRALEDGRLMSRCEHQALVALLIKKGIITQAEYAEALNGEFEYMLDLLEQEHPGVTATDEGLRMDLRKILESGWQKDWPT